MIRGRHQLPRSQQPDRSQGSHTARFCRKGAQEGSIPSLHLRFVSLSPPKSLRAAAPLKKRVSAQRRPVPAIAASPFSLMTTFIVAEHCSHNQKYSNRRWLLCRSFLRCTRDRVDRARTVCPAQIAKGDIAARIGAVFGSWAVFANYRRIIDR